MKRPTMIDVAQRAGVSLKTVSRYVNGETNIDPALAGRIAEAITELGYRRNLSAASIRPGWTSKTIGLITSDLANPYYAGLARSVERTAAAAGYMLMTSSSEEDGALFDRIVDRMLDQRLDGLIVVPPRVPGRPWNTLPEPIPPVVFVDRPGGHADGYSVLADNSGGAFVAVEALHRQGATRVAMVGDSLDIYTMRERHRGFGDAQTAFGLARDAGLVSDRAHSAAEACDVVMSLLDVGVADAIFAANNRATFGALEAFRRAGRWLPIIGFDDFEGATLIEMGVSVVSQDVQGMGASATGMLLDAISGGTGAPRKRVLPTRLVLRGSEKPR